MGEWKHFVSKGFARTIQALDWRFPSPLIYRILAGFLLGGMCLFFLPADFYVRPDFGLEEGWRLVLNRAFSEGWIFGDRIIWTYGPFGFLESRFPYGISIWYYLAFDLLLLVLFLRLAVDSLRWPDFSRIAWVFLLALCCAKRLITETPSVATYCLLAFLLTRNLRRPTLIDSLALVGVSVLLFFYKLNFGLVGVSLCLFVLFFKLVRREKAVWIWLLIVVCECVLIGLLVARYQMNLGHYLHASLAMIRLYGDGMVVGPGGRGGSIIHPLTCLYLVALVVLSLVAVARGLEVAAWPYVIIGCGMTFVLYKTAVIRSDNIHHYGFIYGLPILALAFLVNVPAALQKLWRPFFLFSTVYAGILLIAAYGNCIQYMPKPYVRAFLPINFFQELRQYSQHASWSAYVKDVNTYASDRVVPAEVRAIIQTNSVDVFPFEASLPLCSGLNYQPRPIPQTYTAFGSDLEGPNVAFYQSEQAPRFVLYVMGTNAFSIDSRYHLWDEPAVKRILQERYIPRLVFTNTEGAITEAIPSPTPVLLLERRTNQVVMRVETLETTTEKSGHQFDIPQQEGELYAYVRVRKTLLGRLASWLYRGGLVFARFDLDQGNQREFRVIASNLETGVLVNHFSDQKQADSVADYFCHNSQGNPKCRRVGIYFQQSWEYEASFEVTYFRVVPSN